MPVFTIFGASTGLGAPSPEAPFFVAVVPDAPAPTPAGVPSLEASATSRFPCRADGGVRAGATGAVDARFSLDDEVLRIGTVIAMRATTAAATVSGFR